MKAKVVKRTRITLDARYRDCPLKCPMLSAEVKNLSDFFAVFSSVINTDDVYWFRGHADLEWQLVPSALRYKSDSERGQALGLVSEMRRLLEFKLPRPPADEDRLSWIQIAQHYGLPTRLLDWTQNAAIALYFTCAAHPDKDGLVTFMNPVQLNTSVDPQEPRIFDYQRDATLINSILAEDGRPNPKGRPTIAINPAWNSERIILQQGTFTLHGCKHFSLDSKQVPSLAYVPILGAHKNNLRNELERVGVAEMFVYPELEHVCSYLRRRHKL